MQNWKPVQFDLGNGLILGAEEAFGHTLVIGGPGAGKTHLLTSVATQLVQERLAGNEVGFTVLGMDLPQHVAEICEKNNVPYSYLGRSAGFNPLAGSPEEAADLTASLVEQSSDFLSIVQRVAIRNTVLLLKHTIPDATLFDVLYLLRDRSFVKHHLVKYKEQYGDDDLVKYFESEVIANDRFDEFVLGLRMKLEDLFGNRQVKAMLTNKEYIDFDKLLADGGILLVENDLPWRNNIDDLILGDLLRSVLRRSPNSRPHYVLLDSGSQYRLDKLHNISKSHRCGFFITTQTMKFEHKKSIAMQCRNKLVFGHLCLEDAEELARELGTSLGKILELPRYHFISKIDEIVLVK